MQGRDPINNKNNNTYSSILRRRLSQQADQFGKPSPPFLTLSTGSMILSEMSMFGILVAEPSSDMTNSTPRRP